MPLAPGYRLNTDKPRPHHYEFAHVVVRAIALRAGRQLIDLAAQGELGGQLRQTWLRVGEALPPDDQLRPDGLAASYRVAGGLATALLTLPAACHIGEAYLIAVAVPGTDALVGGADPPRFFLLEHSWTVDNEPATVVAEWTRDGRHIDYGEGPLPEPGAFLEAIARVCAIGS